MANNSRKREERLKDSVGNRQRKRLRRKKSQVWFGLGMIGVIGWSVTIPILIGVALGAWLDAHWPARISWKLTGIIAGAVAGCLNGWYWVQQEIRKE
jgi:ATP synthase protein I